ncbi:MAG: hypothetical protein K9H64_14755 [Bacteroidales bacterium]|nr:hypothetical protein [Bacteroidales bacterium]MCF8457226.1 hypothetical protein [Bacteroidales bacterium]
MKILLDECVTKKAKKLLLEFDVFTVYEVGFSGLKNGKLLAEAENSGFDILLTIDKNIDYQQNIGNFKLAIVVLDVVRSSIKYIEELIPKFKNQINTIEKGKSYRIEK